MLLSNVKTKWKKTPNFYGLLRKPELYTISNQTARLDYYCIDFFTLKYDRQSKKSKGLKCNLEIKKYLLTEHILHCFSHTISNQTTWLEYYCIDNLSYDDRQNCKVHTLEISFNNALVNLLCSILLSQYFRLHLFLILQCRRSDMGLFDSNKNLNRSSFQTFGLLSSI